MARLSVRNNPVQVHQAGQARAARDGTGIEAEVRSILESAVSPQGRVKLGTLLADLGRQAKFSEAEFAVFAQLREVTPGRPLLP